jgi:predicted thioesterase
MLEKGLSARSAATVAAGNTAAAMGSGDLAVFATPAMVALMENAAMTAVAGELPEGATTVGSEMNVTHIKPSGLGAEITATAVLTGVEGRKLTFNVGARDAEGMIGEGIHIRYVVDRAKFMAKLGSPLDQNIRFYLSTLRDYAGRLRQEARWCGPQRYS